MPVAAMGGFIILVAAAVGSYYLWAVRAVRVQVRLGIRSRRLLRLPRAGDSHAAIFTYRSPFPQAASLAEPWDPAVDDSLKMQDMALFNGRYYLYHGAGRR